MRTDRAGHQIPRLCFVGPLVGSNPGHVITQGERLSAQFRGAGYPVIAVSRSPNRYVRLVDMVSTLFRRRREIDVLIIHTYSGPSFLVEDIISWLGRRFGHVIIMLLHGGAIPEFIAAHPHWTQRVLKRADGIVAPSEYLARAVRPLGLRSRVIPNVFDVPLYPFRQRAAVKPRLLWVRTFHPIYNPLMALRVLARLRQTSPDATLVMAGQEKGMQARVQAEADRMGLRDAVRFPGFLDMAGKLREGLAADIFINTNHVDNFPVTLLEMCALGLPVVATTVGGIPDLLRDGQTGLLVPDDDDEAMAAAVRRLLQEPDLTARLSAQGRLLAERSTWERVRPQWEEVFEELTSPAPAAARGIC
jgi:L-malate glycosyltransferase